MRPIMDKITGDSIDLLSVQKITSKHLEMLQIYSNLLNEVEELDNQMKAMKLVDESSLSVEKSEITDMITKTVSNMVLDFVKITSCLHNLENLLTTE